MNKDNSKPMIPNAIHKVNSTVIEKALSSRIPKKGPTAVPNTKLNENKLIPSLLRVWGVTYAAIVPVAVVAIAVAIPFIKRTNIKK